MKTPVRILLSLSLLLLLPRLSSAAEPTVLSEDTVWKGVVDVAGETIVDAEATLLVLPGTTVRFAKAGGGGEAPPARLIIRGVLVAQGTPEEPILFTSAAEKPQAGDWGGIGFDRSPDRVSHLRHCRVEYAAAAVAGGMAAVIVEDCVLTHSQTGVSGAQKLAGGLFGCEVSGNDVGLFFNQSAGFLVENCRIQGNVRAGIACANGSAPRIANCLISDNGKDGIACVQGSSPAIEGNEISGHERGVHLELKSSPGIFGNTIRGNQTGVWAEKLVFPTIEGNVITGNKVGIYCNFSAYPQIHGNDLSGNEALALALGDNQSVFVEKQIPYRDRGQFYSEVPKDPQIAPPQTRKFGAFQGSGEGLVDARGNWWGAEAAAQMKAVGEKGNVAVIEDSHDKPDTDYLGKKFPRDTAVFAPWEERRPVPVGRPAKTYSGVRGKVILEGKPAAGARVHVYEEAGGNFTGEGFAYTAPTGKDGTFTLNLRPGRYFLVGKRAAPPFPSKEPGPEELFGYYGGNPVTVSEGAAFEANVQVVRRKPPKVEKGEGETAVLEGVVLGPKGPEEGASVYLYPDARADFRGPDLSGPQGSVPGGTGPDGRFSLEVPPGTYYLVGARRRGGAQLGPLRAGDHYGYFDGNPVKVEAGHRVSVDLQLVEKLREGDSVRPGATGVAGIRGVLRDASGKPRAGLFAFASNEPNLAGGMPPFRSQPVGADGVFFIDLPKGGTYYVAARSGYGGPPLPGQWQGIYGDKELKPVTVEEGRVAEGIDITVRTVE